MIIHVFINNGFVVRGQASVEAVLIRGFDLGVVTAYADTRTGWNQVIVACPFHEFLKLAQDLFWGITADVSGINNYLREPAWEQYLE